MQGEFLTADEFNEMTTAVTDAMVAAFRTTTTPLSSSDEDFVRLVGTGTFFGIDGLRVILTCRHVVIDGGVEYGFFGSPEIFVAGNQVVTADNLDSALINIPDFIWDRQSHQAHLLSRAAFAQKHDPVENEVFFVCGFASENSHFGFGQLVSTATGYGVQINKAAAFEDRFFYLTWRPGEHLVTPETDPGVARDSRAEEPHGFSGAVVWDTGFVRAYSAERDWTPADARITGLITSWDQRSHSLVARRIEDVLLWMDGILGH